MDHIVADIADFTTLAEVDFGTLAGGTALKNGKLFMLFQLHIHQQATPFYATSAAVAGVMGRAMHLGVYGDDPAAMIHQLYKANPATLFDSQQRLLLPIPLAAAVASATGRAMHLGVYGDDPATVIHRLCKANPSTLFNSQRRLLFPVPLVAAVAGVMGRAMHLGVYGDDPATVIHQLCKANPATPFDSQQRRLLSIPLVAAVASDTGRAMHLGVYGDDPATVIHRLCKANPAMLYDSRPQCGVSFLPPALPSRVSRESTVTTAVPFPLLFCCCDCCEGC